MIDGTVRPKIPSTFAKRTARYNEFAVNGAVDIDVVPTTGRLFQTSEVILASDR